MKCERNEINVSAADHIFYRYTFIFFFCRLRRPQKSNITVENASFT